MVFQDKVMSILTSMEARLEALTSRMETHDHEVREELAIYKAMISGRVVAK